MVLSIPLRTIQNNGLRRCHSRFFERAVRRLSGQGFKLSVDLMLSSPQQLRFHEVPYKSKARHFGESKLDALVLWESLALLLDKMLGSVIPVRFLMFAMVGVSGIAVHLVALRLAMLKFDFMWAQALATVPAMTSNFFANNTLTYRDCRLTGWDAARGLLSFYAVCSIGAIANVGVAQTLFANRSSWLASALAGIALSAVWNYAVSYVLTWKGHGSSKGPRSVPADLRARLARLRPALALRWSRREQRLFDFVLIAAVAAYVAQVWVWPFPPLVDWPNHMARYHLESLALSGQSLPQGIELQYSIMPNLGGDLVVPLLLQAFPLTVASRLFLTFNLLACAIGYYLFVRMQSRQSAMSGATSLLVLPWILTSAYFFGFLNFTSGLGLSFLVACNYLRLTDRCAPTLLQCALHGLAVALLFVWHLAAFGAYALIHVSHVLWQLLKKSQCKSRAAVVRSASIFAFLTFIPSALLVIAARWGGEVNAVAGAMEWRPIGDKIKYGSAAFATYDPVLDTVVLALFIAAVVLMVRTERMFRLELHWLHFAIVLFAGAFIAMPYGVGTTWGADVRLLPPLLICGIALLARLPSRNPRLGALLVLAAVLIKLTSIQLAWTKFESTYASHIEFIKTLPPKSRILSVGFNDWSRFHNEPHVISYAVPFREAFVSSLFAIRGQQPLRLPLNEAGPFELITPEGMHFDVERVRKAGFEYVWVFNPLGRELFVPQGWTRSYAKASISVWKIG